MNWKRCSKDMTSIPFPSWKEERILGIVTKFDFLRAFVFTTGQMVPDYDELMRRSVAE